MTERALGVVMPVYNEAAVLEEVIDDIIRLVLDVVDDSELLVVDDGSTDGSGAVLAAAAERDPRVRVVTNDPNLGHGPSVRRGMDASTGRWILHVDSDGQLDLTDFSKLWELTDDHDLVLGVREVRGHDPLHRRCLSVATRQIASVLARHRVRDANTPFKLVRRSLMEHLAPHIPTTAFAPTVAIVIGAHRSGARVAEVEITHLPRPHGHSTLRPLKLTGAAVRSGVESVRVAVGGVTPYAAEGPPDGE